MKPASAPAPPTPDGDNVHSTDSRLQELRYLVLGPQLDEISRMRERLDNPERRAEDLSQILPLTKVRKSLEQSIKTILKREPDVVMEAIRPVLLAAVRKAVTDAFREFTESLNEIAEKSLSIRSLQWRFEAARTGKKFSDIMLSRSLLYSVREVFLIHRSTGVMLNQARRQAVSKDPDMIASMFTAIQEFVRDSFIGTENTELETIDTGSFKLWVQHGNSVVIAGVVEGSPPGGLRAVFRKAVDEIQQAFAPELNAFHGDVTPFAATRPILEKCLLGGSPAKPKKSILLWLLPVIGVLALGLWAYFSFANQQRWRKYISLLERQPGLVVTRVENRAPGHVIYGLRDRLAQDPKTLLAGTGIRLSDVAFQFEPYNSLDPALVARREIAQDSEALQRAVVRFPQGKADLSQADLDRIEQEIAPLIKSLLNAARTLNARLSIQVMGHTDESGSEESNSRLSSDRAENVKTALIETGVDAGVLIARGVASSEPVRQGSSERDRSHNRSATFRVVPVR